MTVHFICELFWTVSINHFASLQLNSAFISASDQSLCEIALTHFILKTPKGV